MPTVAHLSFETLNGTLKAAGEATRLRILALLGEAKLARELVSRLDPDDATLGRDRERLFAVRTQRAEAAQVYFGRHAAQWDRIRKLHVADEAVEEAISAALA